MQEAQKRDAVKRGKFWFRNDIISQMCPATSNGSNVDCAIDDSDDTDESCALMSVDEIINGRGEQFPGLVPLLRQYLLSVDIDAATHCTVHQYLNLIAGRASGKYATTAQWIRQFVRSHPDYQQNSAVTEKINYDLTKLVSEITVGKVIPKELIGDNPIVVAKINKM